MSQDVEFEREQLRYELEHERLHHEVFQWILIVGFTMVSTWELAAEGRFAPRGEFWPGWGWAKALGAGFLLFWGAGLVVLFVGFLAERVTVRIERRRRARRFA
jgi:hypothetical protein